MPLLFSYGTLQEPAVQLSTFGRRLIGQPDALVGFERALVPIDDPAMVARLGHAHHANVVPSTISGATVPGTALEVTDAELAQGDEFESEFSYRRISATLASGREAWVYVHDPASGA